MMRTNRVGATASFEITGTLTLALQFGDTYLSLESGEELPPVFGWRMADVAEANDGSWTTGVASGTVTLRDTLDPAATYIVELMVMRLGSVVDGRLPRSNVEAWREVEEGLPDHEADPEDGFGPAGRFLELTAILVDATGSVNAPSPVVADQADVIILGGLMTAGRVAAADGAITDTGAVKNPVVLATTRAAADLTTPHRVVLLTSAGLEIRYSTVGIPRVNLDGSSFISLGDFKQGQAVLDGITVPTAEHQSDPTNALEIYDVDTIARGPGTVSPEFLIIDVGAGDIDFLDLSATPTARVQTLAASIGTLAAAFRTDYGDLPVLIVTPYRISDYAAQYIGNDFALDLVEQAADAARTTLISGGADAAEITVVKLRPLTVAAPSEGPWDYLITEAQADYLARVGGELYAAIDALIAPVF